nr:unnamed protein product [Callosobruchus analis]
MDYLGLKTIKNKRYIVKSLEAINSNSAQTPAPSSSPPDLKVSSNVPCVYRGSLLSGSRDYRIQ